MGTEEVRPVTFAFHLLERQWSAVLEKPRFIVVHVHNNRTVPVQLGENSQLQAGQPRFGYVNDIALNLPCNVFHTRVLLRKVAAGETFYGNPATVAQRLPDLIPESGKVGADQLNVVIVP